MLSKKGFSLVEVIVSITIIGIVGVILTTILNRTFQANDKSQLIGVIRQNGSLALNIMQEVIRTAEKVVCTNSPTNSVLVIQKRDGSLVRFSIKSDVSTENPAIVEDFPSIPADPNTFAEICNFTSVPLITSNMAYITNKDPTYGVKAEGLNFELLTGASTNEGVKVLFELVPPINAQNNFSNQLGGGKESFQTTILIR